MRAVSAGLVVIVAVAAIYVWSTRQTTDNSQASSGTPKVTPNSTAATSNTTSNVSNADTKADSSLTASATDDQADAVTAEQQSRTDPFRVVESDDTAAPAINDNVAPPAPPAPQVVESVVDESGAERKIVNIPAGGYPVEDSMKYYVPKHLRRPGNLGGPPPPAFMVPEDENGVRSVEAMLPPAPGQ
jgi:hypothetical protein